MKYSILGFNQEKLVNYEIDGLHCDLTDAMLLNYIVYAQANPNMKHILDKEQQPCVWLQHHHVLEDLPILNITEGTLKNRLSKLKKMYLIDSVVVANEDKRGTKTYYKTTSFLNDLMYSSTSLENDVKERARHLKMTSNIKASSNIDNKNKSSIINNTTVNSGKFLGSANKKPKESLYTKVQSSVKALSTDVAIQNALLDFFDLQIEIYREEGKQYYFNIWKSRLNKLQTDFDKKDWLKVIQQSTSQGWKNFYPLRDYSKQSTQKEKAWNKNVSCDKYTEEEEEEQERWREEMRQKGVQVDF